MERNECEACGTPLLPSEMRLGVLCGFCESKKLTARIATLEAELAEARTLLREALPHLHHTGATHHHQCACQVKRRIEAIIRKEDA